MCCVIAVVFEIRKSALAVEKYRVPRCGVLLFPKPISKIC